MDGVLRRRNVHKKLKIASQKQWQQQQQEQQQQ
jgi:hypothetical protein